MKRLSEKKNIAELQVRYGATHERIFKMTFYDSPILLFFQAKGGKFHVLTDEGVSHDVELILSTATFLNLIHCRGSRLDSKTGQIRYFAYTFYDAWAYGDIKVRGDRGSNAAKSFLPIFDAMIGDLQDMMKAEPEVESVA